MPANRPLKEHINTACVAWLADALDAAWSVEERPVDRARFEAQAVARLDILKLRARVMQVAHALELAIAPPHEPDGIARVLTAASGPGRPGWEV